MIDDVGDLEAVEAILSAYESESRIVRTLGEVAAVMGVKPQTVRAWRMESPAMPGEPGRYNLDEIEVWKNQRASRNETPGMAELNVASQRAQLWRRLESVRGKRLKNDEAESRLISVKCLEEMYPRVCDKLEGKFERFHERCAARVADMASPELAEAMSQEIQHSVAYALKELRHGFTTMLDDIHKRKPD